MSNNSEFSFVQNAYPDSGNRGQHYGIHYKPFQSELLGNKTNFPDYLAFNKSDNLHYYNKPYVPQLQPIQVSQQYPQQYTQPQPFMQSANTPRIVNTGHQFEQFQQGPYDPPFRTQSSDMNHLMYIKHVLNCQECKDILTKNLGINNNNAEIIELVSFIAFGILLIFLLN